MHNDEEEKYNSDAQFNHVNKTESKMIDPSHINFEMNEENIIEDDDSEYKEGGEPSPRHKGDQPTHHSNNPGSRNSIDMEFDASSRVIPKAQA